MEIDQELEDSSLLNTKEYEQDENSPTNESQNNGRWTDEEHKKFIEALQLYGKNWNLVHKHVGTRSSAQTRSHAQKFFNKIVRQKNHNQDSQFVLDILNRKYSTNTNTANLDDPHIDFIVDNNQSTNDLDQNRTSNPFQEVNEKNKNQSHKNSPNKQFEYVKVNSNDKYKNQTPKIRNRQKDTSTSEDYFNSKIERKYSKVSEKSKNIKKQLSFFSNKNLQSKKSTQKVQKTKFKKQHSHIDSLPIKNQMSQNAQKLFEVVKCEQNNFKDEQYQDQQYTDMPFQQNQYMNNVFINSKNYDEFRQDFFYKPVFPMQIINNYIMPQYPPNNNMTFNDNFFNNNNFFEKSQTQNIDNILINQENIFNISQNNMYDDLFEQTQRQKQKHEQLDFQQQQNQLFKEQSLEMMDIPDRIQEEKYLQLDSKLYNNQYFEELNNFSL